MKKYILIILIGSLGFLFACQDEKTVEVTYYVTNSQAGFDAQYQITPYNDTLLEKETIITNSAQDVWTKTYTANRGDIYYIAITDTTINSFCKVQVRVNGKIIKEKSRTDVVDMPVVVSGTIPF